MESSSCDVEAMLFPPLHSHFFFLQGGVVGNEEGEDESGIGWNVRRRREEELEGSQARHQRDVLRRDEDAGHGSDEKESRVTANVG